MKILYCPADTGGSAYYRMFVPYLYIRNLTTAHYMFDVTSKKLGEYDLVILQRQCNSELLESIPFLQKRGVKFAYELDDNIFDLPEGNPAKSYWSIKRLYTAKSIIRQCDALIVSTNTLKMALSALSKKIVVIPNYVLTQPDNKEEKTSEVRVVWGGSESHNIDFQPFIIQALKKIKDKHKDSVELIFIGWLPPSLIGYCSFFQSVEPPVYVSLLNTLQIDVGIAPCIDTTLNHNKSNLKFLEYSIARAASIASPVTPYASTIVNNKTGVLVKKNKFKHWYEAIDNLVINKQKRDQIADNAFNFVRDNYLISSNINNILSLYKTI